MSRKEWDELVVGDIIYLFKLDISIHHRINLGIAAELKKKGEQEFIVTRVMSGRSLKVGEIVTTSGYRLSNFWTNLEEGAEWWNGVIRDAEDGLTSDYENKKRHLDKRIIRV